MSGVKATEMSLDCGCPWPRAFATELKLTPSTDSKTLTGSCQGAFAPAYPELTAKCQPTASMIAV
jgi:hypothetical protein